MRSLRAGVLAAAVVMAAVAVAGASAGPSTKAAAPQVTNRYMVVVKSGVSLSGIKVAAEQAGGKVVAAIPEASLGIVVSSKAGFRQELAKNPGVEAVFRDGVQQIIRPESKAELFGPTRRGTVNVGASVGASLWAPDTDPAFSSCTGGGYPYPCMMWSLDRIGIPGAWYGSMAGSADVTVAVADTGIDYTHVDIGPNFAGVKDFTLTEDPPLCDYFFGSSDADLAGLFGAPASDLDFNGHGSWIAGNIAGNVNGVGVNGAAPYVSLFSLKIAQWCGYAFDSSILQAIYYAANNGIDVVNISFGGYLDRTDFDQNQIWRQYEAAVKYATKKGTVLAVSAGNDHTRIGTSGQVISHGALSAPPGGDDLYGLWLVPGGVPGVVSVSSTGNVVNATSATCPADADAAGTDTWCKRSSDFHKPFGVGRKDQLAYYSNYGPRIDVAAPGGARKFNLPAQDGGGCAGWPICGEGSLYGGSSAADGFNAWESFSITSNWAVEIPCINIFGGGFTGECYSTIQGTSMAAPHVAGTLGLIASAYPEVRKNVPLMIKGLKKTAKKYPAGWNRTPPMQKLDTLPMDLTGAGCPLGWCHLSVIGPPVPDSEAYGAGVVNADNAIFP